MRSSKNKSLCLLAVTLILLMIGVTSNGASAEAADDTVVTIAVDNTASSNCVRTLTVTPTGATFSTSTSFPCPTGTLIEPKNVKLSEAIVLHEPYTLVSADSASVETRKKYHYEVTKLLDLKADKVRIPISKTNQSQVHPNASGCDANKTLSDTWNSNGVGLQSSAVDYYVSSDCSYINLQTAREETLSAATSNYAHWKKLLYASASWDVGCTPLPQGITSTFSLNSVQNPGYYLVFYIGGGSPCEIYFDVNHGLGLVS